MTFQIQTSLDKVDWCCVQGNIAPIVLDGEVMVHSWLSKTKCVQFWKYSQGWLAGKEVAVKDYQKKSWQGLEEIAVIVYKMNFGLNNFCIHNLAQKKISLLC
ncbi:hypothetical protein RchiOBHm_Chr5g0008531 [Rosa chinensis]|uniref:Uncharacterized protein n=1 Tax=Rosa chinensis TaxID=74649 RepID=A0A2P6Q473_ROSCH|nr:hypothetical protein RchiOBHm_Chr5g0008531 [Rosa chinensis]